MRKLAKNKRKLQLLHQRMSDRSVAANYDVGSRSGGVPSSSRSDRVRLGGIRVRLCLFTGAVGVAAWVASRIPL